MKPAFNPKAVTTKKPRGPRKTSALPFYKAIGNDRKVARTLDVCDDIPERHRGRVYLDFNADGELIGVEVLG